MVDLALNGARGNSSQIAEGKTKYMETEAIGGQVIEGRELVEARSLLRGRGGDIEGLRRE